VLQPSVFILKREGAKCHPVASAPTGSLIDWPLERSLALFQPLNLATQAPQLAPWQSRVQMRENEKLCSIANDSFQRASPAFNLNKK
jgi:hypothetical protein